MSKIMMAKEIETGTESSEHHPGVFFRSDTRLREHMRNNNERKET